MKTRKGINKLASTSQIESEKKPEMKVGWMPTHIPPVSSEPGPFQLNQQTLCWPTRVDQMVPSGMHMIPWMTVYAFEFFYHSWPSVSYTVIYHHRLFYCYLTALIAIFIRTVFQCFIIIFPGLGKAPGSPWILVE